MADIAYDGWRKTVWMLGQDLTVPDRGVMQVVEIDPANSTVVETHDLPESFRPYPSDHVRVGPDGAVWVSAGYSLGHLSADGKLTTRTFDMPPIDGGLSGPSSTAAGNYITAITPEADGRALISRSGVTSLTELDATLGNDRAVAAESRYLGAPDLVLSSKGLLALSEDGKFSEPSALVAGDATIHAPSGADQQWLHLPLSSTGSGSFGAWTVAGAVLSVDGERGSIAWTEASGRGGQVRLPQAQGQVGHPLGGVQSVVLRPQISAITSDGAGSLFFVAEWQSDRALYRYSP